MHVCNNWNNAINLCFIYIESFLLILVILECFFWRTFFFYMYTRVPFLTCHRHYCYFRPLFCGLVYILYILYMYACMYSYVCIVLIVLHIYYLCIVCILLCIVIVLIRMYCTYICVCVCIAYIRCFVLYCTYCIIYLKLTVYLTVIRLRLDLIFQ